MMLRLYRRGKLLYPAIEVDKDAFLLCPGSSGKHDICSSCRDSHIPCMASEELDIAKDRSYIAIRQEVILKGVDSLDLAISYLLEFILGYSFNSEQPDAPCIRSLIRPDQQLLIDALYMREVHDMFGALCLCSFEKNVVVFKRGKSRCNK